MKKNILRGILGGAVGGALVDLIFLTFAGPSSLFTLLGITDRFGVFLSHVVLGIMLGILFVIIISWLPSLNKWVGGTIFGLLCLAIIGGIPSSFVGGAVTPKTTVFGFIVWILFGLILAKVKK